MLHSTPQLVPQTAQLRRAGLWPLLLLIPVGVLVGVLSGALMNGFNGWLSPAYFLHFLWDGNRSWFTVFEVFFIDGTTNFGRWINVVLYGMKEGFWFGLAFSTFFVFCVSIISKFACPFRIGLHALMRCIGLLWLAWILCGLNALLLRYMVPSFLQPSIIPAWYRTNGEIWVQGAIMGFYPFSLVAVIVGCIWFSFDWRNHQRKIRRE